MSVSRSRLRARAGQIVAQDDGSRIGKLTEIRARVGVVDDGIGGCVRLQPGPAEISTRGPRRRCERIVRPHAGGDERTDFVGDTAVRP